MEEFSDYLKYLRENIKYKKDKKEYEAGRKDKKFIEEYLLEYLKDKTFLSVGGYSKDLLKQEDKIRNLIEKIAVWYEFRYPTDDIDFSKVDYEKDRNDLFNLLSMEERLYLYESNYPSIVYIDNNHIAHFHLDKKGIIEEADGLDDDVKDINFEGKSLKFAYDLLVNRNEKYYKSEELNYVLSTYEGLNVVRTFIKLAISYRIVERGNIGIGGRRAYIFGKAFGVSDYIRYAVDTYDPKLKEFLQMYIDDGGDPNMECLVNYKSRLECVPYQSTVGKVLKYTNNSIDNVVYRKKGNN